jgi:hypothetical protein
VAVDDITACVGAAHGRSEQLPHVCGDGLEPRVAAAVCSGRGVKGVGVSSLYNEVVEDRLTLGPPAIPQFIFPDTIPHPYRCT